MLATMLTSSCTCASEDASDAVDISDYRAALWERCGGHWDLTAASRGGAMSKRWGATSSRFASILLTDLPCYFRRLLD